jgi:hypothetical protein
MNKNRDAFCEKFYEQKGLKMKNRPSEFMKELYRQFEMDDDVQYIVVNDCITYRATSDEILLHILESCLSAKVYSRALYYMSKALMEQKNDNKKDNTPKG